MQLNNINDYPLSTYTTFSEKNIITYPLTRTEARTYQGVRNVSFAYVVIGWSLDMPWKS